MKRLVLCSAAVLAVIAPASAYAGNGHGGGGGGGGGGSPTFTLSVPASASIDQIAEQSVAVIISRTSASSSSLKNCSSTVTVSTSPNTDSGTGATAGTDYTAPAASATIAKGQTSTTVSVPLIHETDNPPGADASESFNVTISNPTSSCKAKTSSVSHASDVITIADGRTVFHVPDGGRIQLSAMALGGCDSLYANLLLSTGDTIPLGNQADLSTCAGSTNPTDVGWTNKTGGDVVATVGLTDVNCNYPDGVTYYSDTTSDSLGHFDVNHALVTPVSDSVWTVGLSDTGGGCGPYTSDWNIPAEGTGAFTGTVTIAPAP